MEQQEQNQPKTTGYVLLTMEILEDKTLSTAEKFVLARITGFDKAGGFYESVENTASALGISKRMVQYARKHLEELGYIETVGISDLGTKLIKIKSLHPEPVQPLRPGATIAPGKGGAKSAPGCKICPSGVQPLRPIIKGEERLSSFDKSKEEAPAAPSSNDEQLNEEPEQPARYGNAEVNKLLDLWQEQTGFSHHGTKAERYAINNLLRKNGYEATEALIKRVGAARRSDDQFAPQIAKPSQLQGKYSKLEALTMWEERQHKQEAASADHPDFNLLYPVAQIDDYDYRGDKTKEELHADAQNIRDKWAGTKYEFIFKRKENTEDE